MNTDTQKYSFSYFQSVVKTRKKHMAVMVILIDVGYDNAYDHHNFMPIPIVKR